MDLVEIFETVRNQISKSVFWLFNYNSYYTGNWYDMNPFVLTRKYFLKLSKSIREWFQILSTKYAPNWLFLGTLTSFSNLTIQLTLSLQSRKALIFTLPEDPGSNPRFKSIQFGFRVRDLRRCFHVSFRRDVLSIYGDTMHHAQTHQITTVLCTWTGFVTQGQIVGY